MDTDRFEQAVVDALGQLGLHPRASTDDGADLVLDQGGRRLQIEIKHFALVDQARASQLVREEALRAPSPGRSADWIKLVVADRVVAGARDILRDAAMSWFDLRGHLHVRGPSVFIDADVPRYDDVKTPARPFAGRVGLATAIDLLLHPHEPAVVRQISRRVHASPSSVSTALKALRSEGLLGVRGDLDQKALFWETARAWKPRWVSVQQHPHPNGPMRNPALQLELSEPSKLGWALSGDVAAAHLGAPIGVGRSAPPSLYVPTQQVHRLACSILGASTDAAEPAARLAVAPVAAACENRLDVAGWANESWPVTRPLFIALDLAQDPGRGAEILREWTPEAGGSRVW